jgi:hypothetical protein
MAFSPAAFFDMRAYTGPVRHRNATIRTDSGEPLAPVALPKYVVDSCNPMDAQSVGCPDRGKTRGGQRNAAHPVALLRAGCEWPHQIYFCVRRNGRRLRHGWLAGSEARQFATILQGRAAGDRVELFVPTDVRVVADGVAPPARWTGIHGLEAWRDGRVARMAPSHMIAANHTWARALDRCRAELGGAVDRVMRLEGSTVLLGDDGACAGWHRSGPPVDAVDAAELAHALGGWLVRNTAADGRLTYKY